MPNLNEFMKPPTPTDPDVEKISGAKPCKECEKDSEEYYWNPVKLEMSWVCPDGHKNSYRIN